MLGLSTRKKIREPFRQVGPGLHNRLTPRTFARRIAHQEGIKPISNADLEYFIWERTGWPAFWDGPDPLECFERQLRTAFREARQVLE